MNIFNKMFIDIFVYILLGWDKKIFLKFLFIRIQDDKIIGIDFIVDLREYIKFENMKFCLKRI